MNTLETVLALIFIPTSIVGGIIFILRKFFEQALLRDIKKYEAKLQAEFEHAKMRFDNELQGKLFEFQTKFSLYHQRRAEVIGELYGMLHEAVESVSTLISPIQFDDGKSQAESYNETLAKCRTLREFFMKRRIFLEEDVCDKLDSILQNMHVALTGFRISQEEPRQAGDRYMRDEAWNVINEAVPLVKNDLERQFRKSLSVTTDGDAQQLTEPDRP